MTKLNQLKPRKGSVHTFKRVGRGIGSGKGKTSGRGVKGQKARTGVSLNGFEGGQMPLYRRMPKSGFTNIHALDYIELTTGRLQEAIDAKLIDGKNPLDADALVKAKVIRRKRDGVKLLFKGELKSKLQLTVSGATKGAIAAIEKAGGKVTIIAPKVSKLATAARAGKKNNKEAKGGKKPEAKAEAAAEE
jgi:large subunit ribosomal protein L15